MADWRHDIMRRYPQLFDGSGRPTVGDGWRDLVERAITRIAAALACEHADAQVRIVQIKEKFGTLRLYWHGRGLSERAQEKVDEAVDLAEARSACTCESCGREGRLYVDGRWYLTRCAGHAQGSPVPIKPGWENLHVVETISGGKFRILSCRRYDRERDAFVDVPPPADREGDKT